MLRMAGARLVCRSPEDAVKFFGREVFPACFGRLPDSIKARKGAYFVRVNTFRFVSAAAFLPPGVALPPPGDYQEFVAGLIGGALAAVGVDSNVTVCAVPPPDAEFVVVPMVPPGAAGATVVGSGLALPPELVTLPGELAAPLLPVP